MGQQPHIYGIDIETDTRHDGLDPLVAPILSIALSGRSFEELFVGDEGDLLASLDRRLGSLPDGVVATWNGATFDLPFIADRAQLLGMDLALRLCPDRTRTRGRQPLRGHGGAYRGAWHGHRHLDTFGLYGGPATGRPSLRAIGRMIGLSGREDATTMAPGGLVNEVRHANPASDARLARVLAERRWSAASRVVDHLDEHEAQAVEVAVRRLERRRRNDHVAVRPAVV